MNSKIFNIIITIFMIIILIVGVGAEGNLSNNQEENNQGKDIIIEEIETQESETAINYLQDISEDNKIMEERVESYPPEEVTSEKKEAKSENEEASLSSQNNSNKSKESEKIQDIPFGEVLNKSLDETSPSPNKKNKQKNQTKFEIKKEINTLSNESQNHIKDGSGQKQEVQESFGQIESDTNKELNNSNKENSTLHIDFKENQSDVRGNAQSGTGETNPITSSSVPSPSSIISSMKKGEVIEKEKKYLVDIDKINKSFNETIDKKNQSNIIITLLHSEDNTKIVEKREIGEINYHQEVIEETEFTKKIKVYSEKHIKTEVLAESELSKEVVKDKIKIYWRNNGDLEITNLKEYKVKYYDENNNGLVDKVTWMVPHLSDQYFEIVIEPEFISDKNKKENIQIITKEYPSNTISNPIKFGFDIMYINASNVSCELEIKNSQNSIVEKREFNYSNNGTSLGQVIFNLNDGDYSWQIKCLDIYNNNITSNPHASGNFKINEGFEIRNLNKFYFLNLIDNKIKNPGSNLEFYSINSANKNFTIKREGKVHYTGTGESISLNEEILNYSGDYQLIVDFKGNNLANSTLNENFSVVGANITFQPGVYEIGENIPISFKVDSFNELINYVIFRFGDGEDELINVNEDKINRNYLHSYNSHGDYDVSLEIKINGDTGFFTIDKTGIVIESTYDNNNPEVTLIYPNNNDILESENITFEFKVSDEVHIENCTFRLYNNTNNEEFTDVKREWDNLGKNHAQEYKVIFFEKGDYWAEVECYDNSSNKNYDFNSFQINFGDYESSNNLNSNKQFTEYQIMPEVERVLGIVNDYLENENQFNSDKKEIYEDLGISDNIDFYKKRLLQIDQYFKENYKYVDTEALRKQKDQEYTEEFENIKNNIPSEIIIIDTYEYVKNSVEVDMKKVVEDYMNSTNTKISSNFAKKLANMNLKLQQEISVEANIKRVSIEYENRTEEFTIVKKKIDLNNQNYDQILEIIPKEIVERAEDVKFLIDYQVIKQDPIFEILYEDLTDNKEIIYYIEKNIDLKELTKTQTILFEESFNEVKIGVTGFFGGGFITNTNPIYFALILLLVIVLIILFLFVFGRYRKQKWKKEPNVVKCFELLRQSKVYLKEKDVERARENYRELKKVYPVLPLKPKEYFYNEIKELSIRIDRRDIFNLVKEYEQAKKSFNKEDCVRIYKDIKKVYERLPIKDRQKIFERLNK